MKEKYALICSNDEQQQMMSSLSVHDNCREERPNIVKPISTPRFVLICGMHGVAGGGLVVGGGGGEGEEVFIVHARFHVMETVFITAGL